MFGNHFYHKSIKKYVTIFGSLFNGIRVAKYDNSNDIKELTLVPISYGAKEKFIERLNAQQDLRKEIAILVPRMGFEISSYQYDPSRKLNNINKLQKRINSSSVNTSFSAAPYNIGFSLNIFVRNVEDGTQIIEQILPYFTPSFSTTINLIPNLDTKFDIPIQLNSINMNDDYEGTFENKRIIQWELDFTLKGYFVGPTKIAKPIEKNTTNIGSGSVINNEISTSTELTEDEFGFNEIIL